MRDSFKALYNRVLYLRIRYFYRKKIKSLIEKRGMKIKISNGYSEKIDSFWSSGLGLKINKNWHIAYSTVNGKEDHRYIPEDVFYTLIERSLNQYDLAQAYSDKNNYDLFLDDYPQPETLIKKINGNFYNKQRTKLTKEEVINILLFKPGEIFIKPSLDSGGGKNVSLLKIDNNKIILKNKKLSFDKLDSIYKDNYIIQKKVNQHKILQDIYPHSLNTIRITTLFWDNKVEVLSSVIRFGNKGLNVDNGGIACGIDDDGILKSPIDKNGFVHEKHPYTNYVLKDIKIPGYEEVKKLVLNLHLKLPYFRMVSWDVAIDENSKPILLELNLKGQEINFHQFNNGPIFKGFTEEICKFSIDK
ncbi:sugar-transfer associated ATP-grasp domain-containing protein [Bacillus sp. es.034]|uniref:sugar-transfer associated ATP-grasp domain-containing protein n=1 Tax=Bacillus sp. es.034 TaxID=1761763 RepID=UPI000BF87282|nr:sugar-transfer associated ATP-grasp domain-containing protein [Bacillus sp. es.034]PFG04481.1 putative polysaccharide biosynthesis protein [Bacillus sp. es.034]